MARALHRFAIGAVLLLAPAIATADGPTHDPGRSHYRAPTAKRALTVDGIANEPIWQRARWHDITHRWLGPEYSAEDFQGRFKVVWTPERIYILAEIVDGGVPGGAVRGTTS